jgi:hypothetical protein
MVEHDHLPWPQHRRHLLPDVPRTGRGLHRALDQPGCVQTVGRERRHHRGVRAVGARHRSARPLVVRRPAGEPRQGGVGAACVDQDELLRVALGGRRPPGGARLLVARGTAASDFLYASTPAAASPATASPRASGCPWCSAHHARCSSTVASGAASSRARRSASCSRPIVRGPPGSGVRSNDPVACCRTPERFTAETLTPKRRAASRRG